MRLGENENSVLSHLSKGRDNARTAKFLSIMTGLSDVQIRTAIRNLIMESDYLIGSATEDPAGFYLIESSREFEDTTKTLRSRGIKILQRAAKIDRMSLDRVYGQAKMEFAHNDQGTI